MKKQYIECGKIVSTHGIRGEMKSLIWTDDPDYLLGFDSFYLEKGKSRIKVKSSRIHKKMLLLTVEGVNSIEDAAKYRGQVLYINREEDLDDRPFLQDFLGVEVMDIDNNKHYGEIIDIIITGANDVYVTRDSKDVERLIPDIPHVVLETDLNEKRMKIRPLKGLFDDEN